MHWHYIKLSELAEFKNGLNYSKDNWGVGLKVIGVADFKNRMYPEYENLQQINPNGVVRKSDYLEEGDILFVRSNGNRELIGRSLLIKGLQEKISHSGFTIRARFFAKDVFIPFYFYVFKSDLIRSVLSLYGGGTNINNLNQGILSRLIVPKIPIDVQKKIAAILSSYDDLIENNQRRITLLEKMAEEIYREWFVRFRFPGYQSAEFEKGIPKGWEVKSIKDIVDRKKFGRIYRESELNNDGKIIVIDQSKDECLGFYDGEPQHKASIEKPIILFGDHTCKMVMMMRDFSLAENVIPFLPKEKMSVYFLFHLIKNKAETTEYKRHWSELTTQKVLIPTPDLENKFGEKIVVLYQQIEALKIIISNLSKTRNQLLPRLISGKLSVENLDIQFPPSMCEDGAA